MDSTNVSLNKWEIEASERPLTSGESIVGIVALVIFGLLAATILVVSLYAIFGPKQQGGLEELYQQKLGSGDGAAAAAPAEAP